MPQKEIQPKKEEEKTKGRSRIRRAQNNIGRRKG